MTMTLTPEQTIALSKLNEVLAEMNAAGLTVQAVPILYGTVQDNAALILTAQITFDGMRFVERDQ